MSKGVAGLRAVKVLTNVTSGTLDAMKVVYMEVTNSGAVDVTISVNDFTAQGHPPSEGIPVLAGTTREIPMEIFNFTATGAVTVVAYGA